MQVLKNQVETLKELCQMQEESISAYAEKYENNSKLIDAQAKKIEQLEAFMCAYMQGSRVGASSP